MLHKKDVPSQLKKKSNITVFKADLANKSTLEPCCANVDTVVHFAGVLFKHYPEKFLHITNTLYFRNLLEVAIAMKVRRVILISFPHVEGQTTPDNPAKGILNGSPKSIHAATRLEEEKLLFELCKGTSIEPVSLRVGMVYGKGILMIEGARFFSKLNLLGIWKEPTFIHLISKEDFLTATVNAVLEKRISGIYHLGDDGVQTLQEFLTLAAEKWKTFKPWIMPIWLIKTAARVFEFISWLLDVKSPLTLDFIKIGQVSYYGDTTTMKRDLLPELKYRTVLEGIDTL